LPRDIAILMVDGQRRFGNGLCLPAGPLREPRAAVANADFVVTVGGQPQQGEYGMALRADDELVAVSPGGVLSNYYCSLARLNVAFSVTLTTVSGFVALAAMPLLFAAIVPAALGIEAFGVPVAEMTSRLLLFLLLPAAAGMALRHVFPAAIERAGRTIRASGLGLLVFFLALVFYDQRHAVVAMFGEAALLTVTFTLLALLGAWLSGRILHMNGTDRAVLAIEFALRNVGIAALLAVTTFQQPEFAAFGALFLLFQAPVLILALWLGKRKPDLPATGTPVG
jgi:BASS family bile acid:Na+ symporter